MAPGIRFWRDELGVPRAAAELHYHAVAVYLERVVGEDRGLADWLMETLDAVASGREPEAQQISTGRSSATIKREATELHCESDEPYQEGELSSTGVVQTRVFHEYLTRWMSFLEGSSGDAGTHTGLLQPGTRRPRAFAVGSRRRFPGS